MIFGSTREMRERLQSPSKDDVDYKRELWCENFREWFNRDLVAVMNISRRGWLRFVQSQGIGIEAIVQELGLDTPILKVNPMNLGQASPKAVNR